MKIQILGLRPIKPNILSNGIMRFTHSTYSHLAILIPVADIYHAIGSGFQAATLPHVESDHVIVERAEFELSDEKLELALGWLKGRCGTEYSQAQYIGFLLPYPWVRSVVANGKARTICSEIVADFIEEILGFECTPGVNDFLDPKTVMELAIKYSKAAT